VAGGGALGIDLDGCLVVPVDAGAWSVFKF